MRPVLFRWRGLTVWSYPAMLYLGLLAGVCCGNLAAHATGLDALRLFEATLILIPPAILGARLLFVAEHWSEYRRFPCRVWDRRDGGMAMYGGLPVMLLLSLPLLSWLGLSFARFWDAGVLTVMAGLAFTKVGCLLNGCCAGRAADGHVGVPAPDSRGGLRVRIPLQCVESGWALVMLLTGGALLAQKPAPGTVFLAVAACHSAGRFALGFRRDSSRGLVWSQAIPAICAVLAFAVLFTR